MASDILSNESTSAPRVAPASARCIEVQVLDAGPFDVRQYLRNRIAREDLLAFAVAMNLVPTPEDQGK